MEGRSLPVCVLCAAALVRVDKDVIRYLQSRFVFVAMRFSSSEFMHTHVK